MSEKDLPERLQLQNERIQEIENKIKKLEDKEQDGKYLMSLKEKISSWGKSKRRYRKYIFFISYRNSRN